MSSGGMESKMEALETLQTLRKDTTAVLVELLDANHKPVLQSLKYGAIDRTSIDYRFLTIRSDSGYVGNICRVGNSLYYPVVSTVKDNNNILGYLVRWRKIAANPRSIQQFASLLGTGAALYIGNADGSLWTDMTKQVSKTLPPDIGKSNGSVEYTGTQEAVIAAVKPVGHTSWVVLVEFSRAAILDSANRFFRWLLIIGAVLTAAGSFVAWLMSRNIIRPLKQLTTATTAIAAGNYSVAVAANRRDEIGKLARSFNLMSEEVRQAHADLEKKIAETGQMNEQLRNLSAHLQNIREEERKRIAREMHDELGQLLTSFKMDVLFLKKKLVGNEQNGIGEKLAGMVVIADDAVKFVRKLASELRPSLLDDVGLVPALEWHSKEFEKRFNINVNFHSTVETVQTSPIIETGLFRMYQESLTNVARHSGAKNVIAVLQKTENELSLSVSDDGKGFNMAETSNRKTLGLLGMRERAIMIGGKLEIESEPGRGTRVMVIVLTG
jgi:signal transduction histidine kinase